MNPELSSIWSREAELEQLIEDLASQAIARKTLGTDEAEHLVRTFNAVPPAEASGLGVEDHSRFVSTNLQLVEICLQEPGLHRPGFVNPLLQQELDRCRLRSGGESWSLEHITEEVRRGTDRRFTFGQVKSHPDDPEDPSFFGGSWLVHCDGNDRRIVFAIVADAVPGSEFWQLLEEGRGDRDRLEAMVRSRGTHPWNLQVPADSPLGEWIETLAGSPSIGQHQGLIPLGVLSEAVRRSLEPRGLTHLLLGPSRRDPPSRPWHTGAFLSRVGEGFDFQWSGLAIEERCDRLVEASLVVRLRARILHFLD